jgi:hypothetical protein
MVRRRQPQVNEPQEMTVCSAHGSAVFDTGQALRRHLLKLSRTVLDIASDFTGIACGWMRKEWHTPNDSAGR